MEWIQVGDCRRNLEPEAVWLADLQRLGGLGSTLGNLGGVSVHLEVHWVIWVNREIPNQWVYWYI